MEGFGAKRPGVRLCSVNESPSQLPESLKRAKFDKELHLESEAVCRDRRQEVPVDLQVAVALKPADRARWLSRAMDGVAQSVIRPSDIFDIVSHKRFALGVSPALARTMLEDVMKRLALFPDKLQHLLRSGAFKLAEVVVCSNLNDMYKSDELAGSAGSEEMMARCVEFVCTNERMFDALHQVEARTFEVELNRVNLQQVWGLTWVRTAFNAQRRVLEAVVPGTPAAILNDHRAVAGLRRMQSGDELVAVNGLRGWQAMGSIRELLHARLMFIGLSPNSEPAGADGYVPPLYCDSSYALDAGDGWRGHVGGQWLFSSEEGVYFHVPTGGLFAQDLTKPGCFLQINAQHRAIKEESGHANECHNRQRGRIRWFSKAKGFGFIERQASEDIFFHRKQLLAEAESESTEPATLLPGTPVTFALATGDDGRPCAEWVCVDCDLAMHCWAGSCTASSGRCIGPQTLELKAHQGQACLGLFVGVAAGCKGPGGAEHVALHLPRDLEACFRGREQAGDKGALTAILAAYRQTQHGLLQYAQQLSKNSANLWLSAETAASTALIFGPEKDGKARVVFATTGGGRALVGSREGAVVACLGEEVHGDGRIAKRRSKEDASKVFEKTLKGPSISFPPYVAQAVTSPKGFGAHNWSEKDGSAAGLSVEIQVQPLNWEEDAVLVIGSSAAWKALPDDEEVVRISLQTLAAGSCSGAAERAAHQLLEVARRSSGEAPPGWAVCVVQLSWCSVDSSGINEQAKSVVAKASPRRVQLLEEADLDDMFAPPTASSERQLQDNNIMAAAPVEDEQHPAECEDKEQCLSTPSLNSTVYENATARAEDEQQPAECESQEQLLSTPALNPPVCEKAGSNTARSAETSSALDNAMDQPEPDVLDDAFSEFCRELEGL